MRKIRLIEMDFSDSYSSFENKVNGEFAKIEKQGATVIKTESFFSMKTGAIRGFIIEYEESNKETNYV